MPLRSMAAGPRDTGISRSRKRSVQAGFVQPRLQDLVQAQGEVRVLGGVERQPVRIHRQDVLAAGRRGEEFAVGHHAVVQELEHQVVQPVAAPAGIQDVGGQHGVEARPAQGQAVPAEDPLVELQVLADLQAARVGQDRASSCLHRRQAADFTGPTGNRVSPAAAVADPASRQQDRHVGRRQTLARPVPARPGRRPPAGRCPARRPSVSVSTARGASRIQSRQPGVELLVACPAARSRAPGARVGPARLRGFRLPVSAAGARFAGFGAGRRRPRSAACRPACRSGPGPAAAPAPAAAPRPRSRSGRTVLMAVPVQVQVQVLA